MKRIEIYPEVIKDFASAMIEPYLRAKIEDILKEKAVEIAEEAARTFCKDITAACDMVTQDKPSDPPKFIIKIDGIEK